MTQWVQGARADRFLGRALAILRNVERAPLPAGPEAAACRWSDLLLLSSVAERAGLPRLFSDEELVDRIGTAVGESALGPALFGGLAQIGLTLEQALRTAGEPPTEVCGDLDGALADAVSLDLGPWGGRHDLINGPIGVGVFLLERLPSERARAGLASVVAQLEQAAHPRGPGQLAWFTGAEFLWGPTQEAFPRGCYDVGVAHGAAGAVALLALVAEAGIEPERCARLIDGAATWILAQRRPGAIASLPFILDIEPAKAPRGPRAGVERLAWCYGDVGTAFALHLAARCRARPDWDAAARELALGAAARPHDKAGAVDLGLCHGSIGLGYCFARLHRLFGDGALADAALAWLDEGAAQIPDDGVVLAYEPPGGLGPDESFLAGGVGVAAALIGLAGPDEPRWERRLLLG